MVVTGTFYKRIESPHEEPDHGSFGEAHHPLALGGHPINAGIGVQAPG